MKILYTLNSGNPGGMEQHVLDLVIQMTMRGHEVHVWCQNGIIYDWYLRAGAKVKEKTIRNDFDLKYINELKNYLVDNKIQIVHAHELKAVVNSLIAGWLAGVKIRISHQHTPFTNWQVPKAKRLVYDVFYALLLGLLGTKEVALTQSIKKVKITSGISSRKLTVIPNGIDTYKFFVTQNEKEIYRREICRRYRIDNSCRIIGNLSRTTKEKGHELLIRAFARCLNDGSLDRRNYVLLICGGGDLDEALWSLSEELGIKDRLVITGRFDEDMKVKLYSSFDYFVFPTLAEGFGIVLIEALISGLPVLASDLPVLKEVGGDYPIYFKSGNLEDLGKSLIRRIYDPLSDDKKAEQSRFIEKNYSTEKFGEKYHQLYESLISP